jgi:hypothetical protein
MVTYVVFVQEEVRAKLPKYQRQTPVKTVDSSTSTPQPQVEVRTKKYLHTFFSPRRLLWINYSILEYASLLITRY